MNGTLRTCRECRLCYRLLPTVNEACRWLVEDDTTDQQRPDRSHIVLHMMPGLIHVTDDATGKADDLPVIVAWIDPDHCDAWKAPAFMRYVLRQTVPVLLRLGNRESAGVLFPPAVTGRDHVVHQSRGYVDDILNDFFFEKGEALKAEIEADIERESQRP